MPPYGDPSYWDAAYGSFGPQDSFEWGDVALQDLSEYDMHLWDPRDNDKKSTSESTSTWSLAQTLNIHPHADQDEPLLMLGCGNSRLGEEMVDAGWRGPLIQVDVSSRVVDAVSQRCGHYIEKGHMNFVQDDATELSAFRNAMISGCVDKGLMDAVFCADEFDQCARILKSVNRVLRPGGVFCFLSFSRPEFVLPKIMDVNVNPHEDNHQDQDFYSRKNNLNRTNLWEDVQVQELSKIMVYRFQKATVDTTNTTNAPPPLRPNHKKKRRH